MIVTLHRETQITVGIALPLDALPDHSHFPPVGVHAAKIAVNKDRIRATIPELDAPAVLCDLGREGSGDAEVEIEKTVLRVGEDLDDVLNA